MKPSFFLAYDGSINSDWVARYGIQLAAYSDDKCLTLVHIKDRSIPDSRLDAKLEHLNELCRGKNVALKPQMLRKERDIFTTLMKAIPAGRDVFCICGARATSRGKGFLAGTISQRLLRTYRFNTLVLRVVKPGQLGCPANVMLPLAGHPRKLGAVSPYLQMLAPSLRKLILLRVMVVNPLYFRYLPATRARLLLREGTAYLHEVVAELRHDIDCESIRIDDQAIISDDWSKEILIQAGKLHSGLILLGASDRFLQSHFYYGNRLEQILRQTPCDVGIYRSI